MVYNAILLRMKKNIRKYNRSGIACCEICNQAIPLEVHHIRGRKIDRYDDPSNRVALCPNCHSSTHEGRIDIHGWAMTTKGRELLYQVL